MFSPKRILTPTDFSDSSTKSIQRALDIAEENGSEIILLHVVPRDLSVCQVDYCLKGDEAERFEDQMHTGALDRLNNELSQLRIPENVTVSVEIRRGHAYEEILSIQQSADIDLIVIGPHGKTGLRTFFMGSTSSRVLKGATCEVLLVR